MNSEQNRAERQPILEPLSVVNPQPIPGFKPELLAPAGDAASFLAALAAGADAVYLGLKHFSARMAADNFGTSELSRMVELANKENRKVYVAFNSLVKPGDLVSAGNLLRRLARDAQPHGLILQDPGLLDVARQAGFEGELHLSTLANVSHPRALVAARNLGAHRALLPRELSIDEVRQMAAAAPEGLDLEMFIHGALCYCVSGRCYWSSYMGGKSGLRGRCVQPCRRVYSQKSREGRYFSCQDLSLDVLVKALLSIPQVKSWKIEGRKKGPHYVYHTVSAYRMLRDEGSDPRARKDAETLLEMALGRPVTRARFLPQRAQEVTTPEDTTSSGLLVGKIQFAQPKPEDRGRSTQTFIKTRQELLPRDFLRVGFEDDPWHATVRVTRRIPKAGTLFLSLDRHKTPKAGTQVFLIDRREPGLAQELDVWKAKLERCKGVASQEVQFNVNLPPAVRSRKLPDIQVRSSLPQGKETRFARNGNMGLWLSTGSLRGLSRTIVPRASWWLPPVIWPEEEAQWINLVREAEKNGAQHFVLGAPWQVNLFDAPNAQREGRELIAGPFCNVANPATVACLARMGFKACFVSPELTREDLLALPKQSCLPLGIVVSGYWPVGIARHDLHFVKPNEAFRSPKGEVFWARNYGQNVWLYPGWPLDLNAQRPELENAGYVFFAQLTENTPPSLPEARRTSTFNWSGELL